MIKILLSLVFIASVTSLCTEIEPSILGFATDCNITRLDRQTIEWTAKINFKSEVYWAEGTWVNVLADMEHPRLPYWPIGERCTTEYRRYVDGESTTLSCTQVFEDVPNDYVNAVYLFENTENPLGFSIKIPLRSLNLLKE